MRGADDFYFVAAHHGNATGEIAQLLGAARAGDDDFIDLLGRLYGSGETHAENQRATSHMHVDEPVHVRRLEIIAPAARTRRRSRLYLSANLSGRPRRSRRTVGLGAYTSSALPARPPAAGLSTIRARFRCRTLADNCRSPPR